MDNARAARAPARTDRRRSRKFQAATAALDKALHHHADGDAFAHAKYMQRHA